MATVESALSLRDLFDECNPEEEADRIFLDFYRGCAAVMRNIDLAFCRVKRRAGHCLAIPGSLECCEGNLFEALALAHSRLLAILDFAKNEPKVLLSTDSGESTLDS